MRKMLILLMLCAVAAAIYAEPADIVYAEGYVDLKLADGEVLEALIGDYVEVGDTIITGEDGLAELERGTGTMIKIAPETIFTLREFERNGEKRSVLSTTLGAVKFRFDRFTGKEPMIATPGTVGGIRGTEFQVLAGADGTTLIVVESGSVEIEAAGKRVELLAEEGIEIPAGGEPGQKFTVLHGKMDFSDWNAGRLDAVMDDPAGAAAGLQNTMTGFAAKLNELAPLFSENSRQLESVRAVLAKMKDDEKPKDEIADYYTKNVFPLEVQTSNIRLNQRFYALSALSFRRFVLGSMYARVKTRYINSLDSPSYVDFKRVYSQILADYERSVVPLLVEADI